MTQPAAMLPVGSPAMMVKVFMMAFICRPR